MEEAEIDFDSIAQLSEGRRKSMATPSREEWYIVGRGNFNLRSDQISDGFLDAKKDNLP